MRADNIFKQLVPHLDSAKKISLAAATEADNVEADPRAVILAGWVMITNAATVLGVQTVDLLQVIAEDIKDVPAEWGLGGRG